MSTNEQILSAIDTMQRYIFSKGLHNEPLKKRGQKLSKKFNAFEKEFPILFSNVVEMKINKEYLERLGYFLEQRTIVNAGTKTYYDASVEVGEQLAKEYLPSL